MHRTYFTREEAQQAIGQRVEALADFPSVPQGSRGIVVKTRRHTGDQWVACVEWHLPRALSAVEAMVGDVSINLFKRSQPVTDQFCKSEYEALLKVLPRG
jgi:hypothetical protein